MKQDILGYDPEHHYNLRIHDVEYRRTPQESWLARVYEPKGDGPFPALLYVHGGAWSGGDRMADAPRLQVLAETGLVIVAIDFRVAPQHPYPAQVADVNYATRWLKGHAADFKVSPNFIGGIGSSSGGHTVMLSAMKPHDPRYASIPLEGASVVDGSLAYILALWPIMDSYARYLFAQETGRANLVTGSEGYFLTKDAMQEGNPQRILDRSEAVQLPPTLIIQGTEDANIPIALTQCFVAAYRGAGGEIGLEQFPGMPHGFLEWPGQDVDRALTLIKTFLVRQLASELASV